MYKRQLQDRGPQRVVQRALPERPGDEPERAEVAAPGPQQVGVGVGGALGEEVGQRARRDVPAGGVERVPGDQQSRYAQGFVARGRGVHDRGGAQRLRRTGPVHRDGPGHRPVRAGALLGRAVGEQLGRGGAGQRHGLPDGLHRSVGERDGGDAVRLLVGGGTGQHAGAVGRLHHDLGQARQGEQQRVVDVGEQAAGQVLGGGVPQREDDDGVVPVRRGPLGRERQAQQRHMALAAAQLLDQARPGLGQRVRLGERPADAAVRTQHGGLVGDGQHGGEADAEAADGRGLVRALGGRTERRERLDGGGVQRSAGVGGGQHPVPQRQPQPAGPVTGPGGGIGGVLRQLDDQPVAVPPERQLLLGIGILPEPGRPGRPGLQHPVPQPSRVEEVRSLLVRTTADDPRLHCAATFRRLPPCVRGHSPPAHTRQRTRGA